MRLAAANCTKVCPCWKSGKGIDTNPARYKNICFSKRIKIKVRLTSTAYRILYNWKLFPKAGGEILEQEKAANLLSGQLRNIFAFSLSRLYDKSEAEDLTSDIICEVLRCAGRLKNEQAFYGFMWRIAENTFKKHIRKSKFSLMEFDENFAGTYWTTPEEEYLRSEELHLLRRELSLLLQ